jgi:hypothetical protein
MDKEKLKSTENISSDIKKNDKNTIKPNREKELLKNTNRRPRDFTVESRHGEKEPGLGDKHHAER